MRIMLLLYICFLIFSAGATESHWHIISYSNTSMSCRYIDTIILTKIRPHHEESRSECENGICTTDNTRTTESNDIMRYEVTPDEDACCHDIPEQSALRSTGICVFTSPSSSHFKFCKHSQVLDYRVLGGIAGARVTISYGDSSRSLASVTRIHVVKDDSCSAAETVESPEPNECTHESTGYQQTRCADLTHILTSLGFLFGYAGVTYTPNARYSPSNTGIRDITHLAYNYAFAILISEATKLVQTSVEEPTATRAPINQFVHTERFATPDFTDVVQPNIDVLYSNAWLENLSVDPMVLKIPDVRNEDGTDRYFLLPILDAYTNVIVSLGLRTRDKYPYPGNYAFVGPNWTGTLPADVTRIDIPTDFAWLLGRIQAFGPEDFANVHRIQRGIKLIPLSAWGTNYIPPKVPIEFVPTQPPDNMVMGMTTTQYFTRLSELWIRNPPLPFDGPALVLFSQIGLVPGRIWDQSAVTPEVFRIIDESYREARTRLPQLEPYVVLIVNYWIAPDPSFGDFGTQYEKRAYIGLIGLGANLILDSAYQHTARDNYGRALASGAVYTLSLQDAPPVVGFWSLTMYNANFHLVANDANIHVVGSNHGNVPPYGHIEIFMYPHPAPAPKVWLPSPQPGGSSPTPFSVTLRLYRPDLAVINGNWTAPGISKIIK